MKNYDEIIKSARRFAKEAKNSKQFSIKIAVLGSASIQYFVMVLRYQLHLEGIEADIYEGEYNGINMDVFDTDSPLYKFNPNVVILLPHYLDIKSFPTPLMAEDDIEKLSEQEIKYYLNVWDRLYSIDNVQILQSTIVIPPEHLLGNIEFIESYSKYNYLERINELIRKNKKANVSIIDIDRFSSFIGKNNWVDYSAYFLSKAYCRLEYIPDFVEPFFKNIIAAKGKNRKCLVLDLDNTLWGGVVGDTGFDGIQIDPNNAVGEAYRYFQQYIRSLKQRGVLLAICSKNDEFNAKEPFEKNENMILRMDDISCFIANWDDKATNLSRIARELNIGIDSLVFFDDNPAEREIVKKFLPEVHVVDVPSDPALYVQQLDIENPFDWIEITKEDILRTNSYVENQKREVLLSQFVDYNEYLKALNMSADINRVTSSDIGRFTQLLNKSNQFNLRTIRYTESEISEIAKDHNSVCLYVKLKDKFTEYGIISCIILRIRDSVCFIESWVMSCRVLKRCVEKLAFEKIFEIAKELRCSKIVGEYIPTKKNSMVSNFYETLSFEKVEDTSDKKVYEYLITKGVISDDIPIKLEVF